MIFYFTGTGNSLDAAKQMAEQLQDNHIVDIAEAVKSGRYNYEVGEKEQVGFIFPVYYYTIPTIVRKFIQNLKINSSETRYIYGIITCGGGIGDAGNALARELKQRGITLNNSFSLLMPDCAVVYYDVTSEEKAQKLLKESKSELKKIAQSITDKSQKVSYRKHSFGIQEFMYHRMNGTKKFWVDENCISCGKCARNCPDEVIQMKDNKPVWEKESCTKCLACINRCPVKAIQYGKGTVKRGRYVNPVLKGK